MNEKTIKRLQELPRVSIENGITYYIIPQEEYEKLQAKEQEVKKVKDKIDHMKEYIKTVEMQEMTFEREVEELKKQNEMLSKNNAVQQWCDMYNMKDKECFNALLKLGKYQQALDEIEKYCTYMNIFNKYNKTNTIKQIKD
jgi:hypothetical protein